MKLVCDKEDIIGGYVPPKDDSVDGKGWTFKKMTIRNEERLCVLNVTGFDTAHYMPSSLAEDVAKKIVISYNSYDDLQAENKSLREALMKLVSIEAWITDPQMKQHFQETVYGTLEKLPNETTAPKDN